MICTSVRSYALLRKSSINCFVKTLIWRNMADGRHLSNVAICDRSSTDRKRRRPTNNTMSNRLVWVDLEMTGLDVDTCQIIEMACLVTDDALNIVAEGPNLIIHQSDEILANMNDWCKEHHGKSGLTEEVRNSTVTLENAEYQMLGFIRQHTPPGKCPLAGNTVHVDKLFLEKYMKQFMYHLHYRIVDVSTVKELCRRWYPNVFCSAPTKMAAHRALDDIKESIKELKYYRENIFLSPV